MQNHYKNILYNPFKERKFMGNLINLPNITPEAMEAFAASGTPKFEKRSEDEFRKTYLDTRVPDGAKERKITIRLLPMNLTTGEPWVRIYTHSVKLTPEQQKFLHSKFKTYVCVRKSPDIDPKFGSRCPFCEFNSKSYNDAQNEPDPNRKKSLIQQSLDYKAKETIVVRCIERGKEDEGVKFWKFNTRKDLSDPYHSILNLYHQRAKEGADNGMNVNILDIYSGRDLTITFKTGEPVPPPTIIDAGISTPLSRDQELMRKWIFDEKKWQDVFPVKPYEYTSLILNERIPWFDNEKKLWVDKALVDGNLNQEMALADEGIRHSQEMFYGAARPVSVNVAPQPQTPPSNQAYQGGDVFSQVMYSEPVNNPYNY